MEYLLENDYSQIQTADNVNSKNGGAHFAVDDLLDFSHNDDAMTDAFFDSLGGDSSTVTAVDSCNSSASGDGDVGRFKGCRSFDESCHFSGNELCVPYDDLAELEWLSNFVEDSFSSGDLRVIPTNVTGTTTTDSSSITNTNHSAPTPHFPSEVSVPGKARSKRSRAVPCDWSSRLLVVSPPPQSKTAAPSKKREPTDTPGRKCLHCASEKTPQWRTGPMGPKTLYNACGVRYKSGRLVPEYRPAASPTFVSARHSNSHRKVLELRRQKEQYMYQQQQHQQLIDHGSVFNGRDEWINGQDLS